MMTVLAALAQPTRLEAFRLLVRHEPQGLPAGEIARLLAVPHNTLSTHLATLAQAGLVRSLRQSRSIIYRAELEQLRAAVSFLVKDCCAAHPELCLPLQQELASCDPADQPAEQALTGKEDAISLPKDPNTAP